MGSKKAVASGRVKKSVEVHLKDPIFTVPEAMLAEIFLYPNNKTEASICKSEYVYVTLRRLFSPLVC